MKSFVKRILSLLLVVAMLSFMTVNVFAEGSKNFTDVPSGSNAYRPQFEWYNQSTAGIKRFQIIKVYVKAGETLLFGSSVYNSKVNPDDPGKNNGDGTKDICSISPDGTTKYYDVTNTGTKQGYIETTAMEASGPRYDDNGITKNNGGYTPFEITVTEANEGIWQFCFYSPYNTTNGNGSAIMVGNKWNENGDGVVGAWDLTVVKAKGSGASAVIPGRVFCDYLLINMGKNFYNGTPGGLYGSIYILTDDGYIYETEFDGLDPWGFVIFANNRGLINTSSGTSLYHSVRDTVPNNDMESMKIKLSSGEYIDASFHLPSYNDTSLDKSYNIFFDKPDQEYLDYIGSIPYVPGEVTDFHFEGYTSGKGYVGNGGWFIFNASRASTFQITLEFAENYNGAGAKANTLYLSNTCVDGENRVYWDGKDANGITVSAGVYGQSGMIKATVSVKAGEYHFPMLDVESNPNGLKITLINTPKNADGTDFVWDNPEDEEYCRSVIYYDNTYIFKEGTAGNDTQGNPLNCLSGISSVSGACKFNNNTKKNDNNPGSSIVGGDYAAIDIWTYTLGNTHETSATIQTFELETIPVDAEAQIKGFVYYDVDTNSYSAVNPGKYEVKSDYVLSGLTVGLYDGTTLIATAETDPNGFYSFYDLVTGKNYTVKVKLPYNYAVLTTHDSTHEEIMGTDKFAILSITVIPGLNKTDDTGIHYELYSGPDLSVNKIWSDDAALDPLRPDSVTVTAVGYNGSTDYITVNAVLSASNGWTHTFTGMPKYADDGVTELQYRVEEIVNDYYCVTSTSKKTDGGAVIQYTFTNTERYITIEKQLEAAADRDTDFLFYVEADTDGIVGADTSFYCIVTVPAGALSAELQVRHLLAGSYTITELNSEWRYTEVVASETKAVDDGVQKDIATDANDKALNMAVTNNSGYFFCFKNKKNEECWLDDHEKLTNTMKPLN